MAFALQVEQPNLVQGGQLRDYQLSGVKFLLSLYTNAVNGILADEMVTHCTPHSCLNALSSRVQHLYRVESELLSSLLSCFAQTGMVLLKSTQFPSQCMPTLQRPHWVIHGFHKRICPLSPLHVLQLDLTSL